MTCSAWRNQWHNLKYYTWVEQQGKTIEELNAQRDPTYWLEQQARVAEVDEKLRAFRESLRPNDAQRG